MDIRSSRGRVQAAALCYLAVFAALNLGVWAWFIVHRHGPHTFPLGERVERFGDLLRFSGKFQYGKDKHMVDSEHLVGTLFPKNYPPFSVAVYLFLLQVCAPYALFVFAGAVVASVVVACTVLWREVRGFPAYRSYMGVAVFATGLIGWATEMTLMRGNIEGLVWIFVCLGAALYARKRNTGAAAAFGVACCVKPYPVFWFALMARQKKYREVVLGLLTAAGVTLASLLAVDRSPLRAYRKISGESNFSRDYIVSFRPMGEMIGDHSLFQSMKTLARVVRNRGLTFSTWDYWMHPNDPLAWKLYHAYLPIAAVLGLTVLWKVWNKPVLNQMFAIACICTTLPMVAADYTLSVLLIPMGFFLVYLLQDVAEGRTPMSFGAMLWFTLPCAWIMGIEPLTNLHGVLKCIALLVLLAATVTVPLPTTLFGEIAPDTR